MTGISSLGIEYGNSICYSGYRNGQSPLNGTYPSYQQVVEDLKILGEQWQYLRIYDSGKHADLVLEAICNEDLDFKVMLGADVAAEMQSIDCPWIGEHHEDVLTANRVANDLQIERMIQLSKAYSNVVFAVSIGNEASVNWSDHQVPLERLIDFVRRVKKSIKQPVTFCENYVPWIGKLEPLAFELDFISIHTYPVWEYHTIEGALEHTIQNYTNVFNHYTDKPVVITEAGWTTNSNGSGIEAWNASEELQAQYYSQLIDWANDNCILTFVFEAFDEPWKGSADPMEPEKHWGLFNVNRKPKLVMQEIYNHLIT